MIKIKQETKEWDIYNIDTLAKDSDNITTYIKIEELNRSHILTDESNLKLEEDEDKTYYHQLLVPDVATKESETTDNYIVDEQFDIKCNASSIDSNIKSEADHHCSSDRDKLNQDDYDDKICLTQFLASDIKVEEHENADYHNSDNQLDISHNISLAEGKTNYSNTHLFKCSICEITFNLQKNFKEHMLTHETPNTKSTFICQVCSKAFTRKSYYNRHLRIHTGIREHKCKICSKSFLYKSDLKIHLKIHTGVKEFECEICHKLFTLKGHLTMHLKIHSGDREHKCVICDKSFIQKSNLNRHLELHDEIQKEFKCTFCNKSFLKVHTLNSHLKIHTDFKELKCVKCNKYFSQRSHLNRHLEIHDDVPKEFKCEICNKLFKLKCYLTSHLKIHSGATLNS